MSKLESYLVDAEPLTPDAFAPFGEVVGVGDSGPLHVEPGMAGPYAQWGTYSIATRDGEELNLDILTRSANRPVEVTRLNRHRLAPQVQVPLNGAPIFIVVAPRELDFSRREDLEQVRAFVSDAGVGVNIGIDVWHEGAYPIAGQAALLNLQGKHHPQDTEIVELDTLLGVSIHIRL
jgi:ureidoglycolate lyase